MLIADKCSNFGRRQFLGADQWREIVKRRYIQRSYEELFHQSYRSVSLL